jgi:lysophospholipase L1-like esterase
MKKYLGIIFFILCIQCGFAQSADLKLILVGDSTMASKNGYGDALCKKVSRNVECLNLAKNGRSSKSYIEEGSWNDALQQIDHSKKNFVLIGFAHNDQPGKKERSTDLNTEFPKNLCKYINDLRIKNVNVILTTPLTRRNFVEDQLVMDLLPWSNKIKEVAKNENVIVIDLYTLSSDFIKMIGHAEADKLALGYPSYAHIQKMQNTSLDISAEGVVDRESKFDHTHLGLIGAEIFSNMLKDLLSVQISELF